MVNDETVNILVVDDLRDKLLALEALLHGPGQNVVTALSGREALRRLLERDFAVILLDVNMPDMDGFETAGLIRRRKQSADTPIIFVTSSNDDTHTAHAYSLGAVDFIFAPVVPLILRTKVGVFVDLYRKTEQIRRQADERVSLAREQAARAAAEEATRRSSFLAEVTSVLASSLDHETTVRAFLGLVVPYLADLAGVTLVATGGSPVARQATGEPPVARAEASQPWRSELAWVSPASRELQTLALTSPDGPDDELRVALERVLASGKPEILNRLNVAYPPPVATGGSPDRRDKPGGSLATGEPPGLSRRSSGEPPVAAGEAGRLHSAALLPLRARGRTLGALVLALSAPGRRFTRADLGYAEDLAGRAAIAIDNARLYQEVQEADRRKNEFLAMLAHELRNPLAPIRSAVQILRLVGSTDPKVRWSQDVIDRQVQQMARLVDDLLDVSRITRGQITLQTEPLDLSAIVSRALEISQPLLDQRRHELTVSLPREGLRVEADPTRLAQVVANLLNNAAKFTPEGGRIGLSATREKDEVVLRVRDSGMGIPADMLASIFDLFTQVDLSLDRSQGGLGIGLTLVRRLVELHKGTVQAFSAGPNQGSEFVVRLPALAEVRSQDHSANGSARSPEPCPPRRIVVVDDNVDGAESLAIVLRLSGHEVRCAHNGPEALEVADGFRPEVMLLDIGLPGMDGYEVARQVQQRPGLEEVLLVALTGYGRDEDRQRAEEAGFDVHLVKPVHADDLPAVLARVPQSRAVGTGR
jgi:signal transduction histidine kinase/DNA-binding response OmpR family regulator